MMTHYGRLFPASKFRPKNDPLVALAGPMFEVGDSPAGFSAIPSGYTYVGQFITHDLSFERLEPVGPPVEPNEVENLREPRLDLDALYGGGPGQSPELYTDDRTRMRAGWSNLAHGEDLPRKEGGIAVIGDPRNDENVIIAQLHLAFIKFHNRVVDVIGGPAGRGPDLFAAAARSVRHHYQWAVVHDFLPRLVRDSVIQAEMDRKDGGIFAEGAPFMPVEFSAAAFRFGHSMVRREYMLEPWFSFPILSEDETQQDLRGGRERRPGTLITDWSVLFGPDPQRARKIDVHVVRALDKVPVGPGRDPQSLPSVDLQKASRLGVPTGQTVAGALKLPDHQRLKPGHFLELKAAPSEVKRFSVETPLWYYCLKEAEHFENGSALGPVGSRIVAQVLIGLLRADRESYVRVDRHWRPEIRFGARPTPGGAGVTFGMRELLAFASSRPARREPFARGLVPAFD
jgi:hypothetical protein